MNLPTTELPNLTKDPSLVYPSWLRALLDLLAGHMTATYEEGLNYFQFHLAMPDPTRTPPGTPATLAKDAKTAEVATWNHRMERHKSYRTACADMKKLVIASLGPVIAQNIADPDTGFTQVTLRQLIDHVRTNYGSLQEADFRKLNDKLKVQFISSATFEADAANFTFIFRTLENAKHPKSGFDKMQILEEATKHLVDITTAIRDYKSKTPSAADRTYKKMVTHVLIQEHNGLFTTTTHDGGFAGAANSTTIDVQATIDRALDKHMAEIKKMLKSTPPSNKFAREVNTHEYCFFHGKGHLGTACRYMLQHPETYNTAMLQATGPCTIGTLHGNKKNC